MIDREKALAVVRADEHATLKCLPEAPPGTDCAFTAVKIPREIYAAIEHPPTKHHVFLVVTVWHRDGWRPLHHQVSVKERGGRYKVAIPKREGAFGATAEGSAA